MDQDTRFTDKQKKLMRAMKFDPSTSEKVSSKDNGEESFVLHNQS